MPVHVLEDGASMAYADAGEGQPVVLVHGWAAHGGFFSDLQTRLARSYRVITPTLRGHVGSTRGTKPLTVETLGEDLASLAAALKLNRLAALGWSMGAMALWSAAPKLRGVLKALVVEEMSPKIVNDEDWAFGLESNYSARNVDATLKEISTDWSAYVERMTAVLFSNSTPERRPDLVRWAAAEMANADPEAMAAYWSSMTAQDFRAALSSIALPVLAVRGVDSQAYPPGANAFVANATPFGSSVALSGAGHVPHLEAPDAFFEHVSDFLHHAYRLETLREGVNP